ncbi:PREDICTED: uncharacterized protein LOC109163032 [Ipomoea nil]|uniref:uncharacterized protein LOC109163032 n=1 Tax=Ipomoea nil TaxID=35883 RepID=UPI0009008B8E|nr:PREDICTED: uncharacterized protein LOC109163032 [Ipomoea nil]
MAQYNIAIGEQRHNQSKVIAENEGSYPKTKSPLSIEKHAVKIYTINIFYEIQQEIWEAGFTCHLRDKTKEGEIWKYIVEDTSGKMFEVTQHPTAENIECACNKFNSMGLLCRHVLLVMKAEGYDTIPEKYIVTRWTRTACAQPMYDVPWARKINTPKTKEAKKMANKLWSEFYTCMGLANGWPKKMDQMLATLQQLKKDLEMEMQETQESGNNESPFERLIGANRLGDIQIKPPKVAKNKGSGKRIKSNKEKATEKKHSKKKERAIYATSQTTTVAPVQTKSPQMKFRISIFEKHRSMVVSFH